MSIDKTPRNDQPPLWIVTHNGKPVTLEQIHKLSGSTTNWFEYDWECKQYVAGRSRKDVVSRFLHYYGGYWIHRDPKFDVQRLLSS